MNRLHLQQCRRWLIKIGSSLVTNDGCGLNTRAMRHWASQIAALIKQGYQVALVSSGSIAEGIYQLGWDGRPHDLHRLQAAAAVGQMGLMQSYRLVFEEQALRSAQILLTHEDLSDRRRYLNARATLLSLLELGVVPIINENDTVSTEEIQLGDNDTLAAQVANLIDAEILLILTDQQGLYDKDPSLYDDARIIDSADSKDAILDEAAGPSVGSLGRGGMITKIKAARQAALSGTTTIIAHGMEQSVISRLADGESLGTCLLGTGEPLALRKRWIANRKPCGTLILDEGACRALSRQGKSLLPVGVIEAEGDFKCGDMVQCQNTEGVVIAYGLVNYSAVEVAEIAGKNGSYIQALMGARYQPELIHRDNLALAD